MFDQPRSRPTLLTVIHATVTLLRSKSLWLEILSPFRCLRFHNIFLQVPVLFFAGRECKQTCMRPFKRKVKKTNKRRYKGQADMFALKSEIESHPKLSRVTAPYKQLSILCNVFIVKSQKNPVIQIACWVLLKSTHGDLNIRSDIASN